MTKPTRPPLPGKDEILRFIEENEGKVGKREIARAFRLRGADRLYLKKILRELADDGLIGRGHRRRVQAAGTLPGVTVIEITGTDVDGELLARPVRWEHDQPPPPIIMAPSAGPSALGVGERVLARLRRIEGEDGYEARTIRRLQASPGRVLGVYQRHGGKGVLIPADKRARHTYAIERRDSRGAGDGELVLAQILPHRRARVLEQLGNMREPRTISLIAIHAHGIPTDFSPEAEAEARAARPASLEGREDLRALPLITIDPADARDHDDAVWAEPTADGGWHVIVAIADVAHYVPAGGALDQAARERGNSVYFPDRVVPMLPEALSTDLCSLKAGRVRACLAVHLWIDERGRKIRHRFVRGLMRSAAALHYAQVQAAQDGQPDEATAPLREPVIAPLYGAYGAVLRERARHQPLDLELPERRIELDADGRVAAIAPRARIDAHRLVEEFMIMANVAAAQTLEKRHTACMYRVHEPPAPEKLDALREFLRSLGLTLNKAAVLKPLNFNTILKKVAGTPQAMLVNQVVLRAQSQAYYSPDNLGHFGLALARYAHFTSPIRRYADVLVHRALIRALKLGDDGLSEAEAAAMAETGEHISNTERRAMAAERDSTDRYISAFMADKLGAVFSGRISGVTRFGLFITLDDSGADGLLPMRHLGAEYFRHDEARHSLVGQRSGVIYRLGDAIAVRLVEAAPITGGLRFDLAAAPKTVRRGKKR